VSIPLLGLSLGWLLYISSTKVSKIEGIFHHLYIMFDKIWSPLLCVKEK